LATKKINKAPEGEVLSSEEEILNALSFAERLSRGAGIYPNVFNPLLLNSRMRDITLTSSRKINSDSVERALENPKKPCWKCLNLLK